MTTPPHRIPPGAFKTLTRADLDKLRQLEQDWPGIKQTLVRLSRHLRETCGEQADRHRNSIVHDALRAYDEAWRDGAADPDRLAAFVRVLIERIGDQTIVTSSLGRRLSFIADSAMVNPPTEEPDGD